jgi:hypothetical protein
VEKVIISAYADNKLLELVDIFYNYEYFGFRVDAKNYVDEIYDFIYTIPSLKHKPATNQTLGSLYCKYKPNRNTTWYVFFDVENDIYLIKNIVNNQSKDYPIYISGF